MACPLEWRRAPTILLARLAIVMARLTVAMLVTALPALAGPARAGASDLSPGVALVLSARATPNLVPAAGAAVRVTARVEHAATCQLVLLSSQSFPVVYSHSPKTCAGGNYSAHVTIGPNSTTVPRTIAFALVARNAASAYAGRFYVRLAAGTATAVVSVGATPSDVPRAGAAVRVTARVEHAATCQLVLLSSQSFPVVYSHSPKTCAGGNYSAYVTIGPNSTTVPRTIAFALVARNAASAYAVHFYVRLAAGTASTAHPVSVPAAAAAPGLPPAVPVTQSNSSNWSGYAAVGGPYTVAEGTFTVPSSVTGTSRAAVSEWVGLDGLGSGDPSLIQAGVDEFPDPADPGGFNLFPWWEILPATETNIGSLKVQPGDKVTVTIWQVSGRTWEINLTDDTTGQRFTTPPEVYKGPGSSAEWVVEATTECQSGCHPAQLAPYGPPIAFSGLGFSGPPETSLQEITMVQGDHNVSTPSALGTGGFVLTFSGAAP